MKTLIISALWALLTCMALARPTVIQGTISGYPADPNFVFVQVVIQNFHRSINPKNEVGAEGRFELCFDLPRTQDLLFSFAGRHLFFHGAGRYAYPEFSLRVFY